MTLGCKKKRAVESNFPSLIVRLSNYFSTFCVSPNQLWKLDDPNLTSNLGFEVLSFEVFIKQMVQTMKNYDYYYFYDLHVYRISNQIVYT